MEINATNRLLGGGGSAKQGANEPSSRKETNLHGLMESNFQSTTPSERSCAGMRTLSLCPRWREAPRPPRASVRTQITESGGCLH